MADPVLRLVPPGGEPVRPPAPAPRQAGADAAGGPRPPATSDPDVAPAAAGDVAPPADSPAASGGPAAPPPAPPAASATGAGDVPEVPQIELYGRPMTAGERGARLARHLTRKARDGAKRPGGLWHDIYHGKPESLAELHAYGDSRAWVPDGHEGSLVPAAGLTYNRTIATAGTAAGLAVIWVTGRMLRLVLFLFVAGILAGLFLWFS